MKAIFKLAFAFVALLSFSACSDVPMPYEQPGDNNNSEEQETGTYLDETFSSDFGKFTNVTVKGNAWAIDYQTAKATGYDNTSKTTTESEAYLVSSALDLSKSTAAYLQFDYILRYVKNGQTENKVLITDNYTGSPSSTTWTDITGTLTEGSDWTTFSTYKKNIPAAFLGKNNVVVALMYSCTTTSSTIELKNLIMKDGTVEESSETPDTPDTPDTGGAKGSGTEADPYNCIAANNYAASLAADTESDKDIYIKGKVVSVKEEYSSTHGNATFYISDDGSADNQFYVFRALYLNNEKYTSGTNIKAGDDVVICGKVVNYKGNTPETVQSKAYLVSLTSNGGGTSGGDEKGDESGDAAAANGNFENWTDGLPNNWKTTSTACNATLAQSTDAHGGKYSVKVTGSSSANKRIGYKETTLKAGDYTMTFYVKAATSTGGSVRPGYVAVTDGKVGNYTYGDYTNNLTNTEWVKVTHSFTIAEDGTYSLVIMNSKNPGGDILIDDFTLTLGSTTIIK